MELVIRSISGSPENVERIRQLRELAELVTPLPLDLNLWKVQNDYWEMLHWLAPEYKKRSDNGDDDARQWLCEFLQLGRHLGFAVEGLFP
jgi:hypothetical protein